MKWQRDLVLISKNQKSADLVIINGRLVNVSTKEVYPADVAVSGNRIAIVGNIDGVIGKSTKIIDAEGMYLVPGLIDSHMHTESSGLSLTELSRLLLPRGITTIMYGHEIANVLGVSGLKMVRSESKQVPLKIFFQAPTSVPWAPGLESTAVDLTVEEVEEILDWEETVSLGESDYFDILNLDANIIKKIEAAKSRGLIVNGHIGALSGKGLNAVIGVGFNDDHESSMPEEVIEKLRLGIRVMLREANLPWLAPAITDRNIDTRNVLLCIDDKLAHTLKSEGGVDSTLRLAISHGIDPLSAIQMATINPAEHFRKNDDIGSISPGKTADILITDSLKQLEAKTVVANGKLVWDNEEFTGHSQGFSYPDWTKNTVKTKRSVTPDEFTIPAKQKSGEALLNVLEITGSGWVKNWVEGKFEVKNNEVVIPAGSQYNKIAVANRHVEDGAFALGVISGIGLKKGAIATTVAHDCHNINIVGTNPEDMALCAEALKEMGGGFVAVDSGKVVAKVQLEIAGLITERTYEEVVDELETFETLIRSDFGFPDDLEIVVFNFIALQSSPFKAAMTDKGLIDVYTQSIIPLIKEN